MNRRGDISILLLTLAVFIICSFALLTFYLSNLKVDETFISSNILENAISKEHMINFHVRGGQGIEQAAKMVDEGFDKSKQEIIISDSLEDMKGFWLWKEKIEIIAIKYVFSMN